MRWFKKIDLSPIEEAVTAFELLLRNNLKNPNGTIPFDLEYNFDHDVVRLVVKEVEQKNMNLYFLNHYAVDILVRKLAGEAGLEELLEQTGCGYSDYGWTWEFTKRK
ncbi:MAG: hypothetical protein ACXABY_07220 [Candidatus Thorarchaeota archaeon]|jgi:hypothetical protein